MSVSERSRRQSDRRIQVTCAVACSICAGLAVWAFKLSSEVVGTAAAQSERPHAVTLPVKLAMAPANSSSSMPLTGPPSGPNPVTSAKSAPVRRLQQGAEPVLIARAQPMPETLAPAAPTATGDDTSADADEWASYEPWVPGRADTFRTVCVRLCDGAYFPVSFSTTRSRFNADASRCQSGCSSPARLFIVKPEGAPEDMVDVRGAAYADLPNAFKFRTAYDPACTCRGQPWDVEAQERHRQLAAVAAAAPAGAQVAPSEQVAQALPAAAPPPLLDITTSTPANSKVQMAALDPRASDTPAPEPSAALAVTRADKRPVKKALRTAPAPAVPAPVVAAVKTPAPAVKTVKTAAVKKPTREVSVKVAHATVVVRANQRTIVAQASPIEPGQRSFGSSDYWRLSVWNHD